MIGELATDEASRAWGYSAYGVVFSGAGIIGTLAGGSLGSLTWEDDFLQKRPYFIACLLGTLLALLGVIVTAHGLGERPRGPHAGYSPVGDDNPMEMGTLGDARRRDSRSPSGTDPHRDSLLDSSSSPPSTAVAASPRASFFRHVFCLSPSSLRPDALRPYLALLTIRTIVPIILYCTYSLGHSVFHTALSLLAASPQDKGGFGLKPASVAYVMTSVSFVKLIFKAGYYVIHSHLGTLRCFRLGAFLMIPGALLAPLLGKVFPSVTWPALYLSAALSGVSEGLMYLSTIMLVTDSVAHSNYGLIHGIAGSAAALVKTGGPTLSGFLIGRGMASGRPWIAFAFVALCQTASLVASRWVVPRPKEEGEQGKVLAAAFDEDGDE
ncbi:major facilitator superfamily domain-containing protein [Blyttiomyces helicus]|uniref:Major facilitator superfamily domain-containing protein n=1 Tax=Blyttiomyces helicus TaxID=388810 RepID=A0A4V1IRZ4_9FUNG|nr:major facilitator superfamily domain-containing protein [Blyttiomyces helicus]|eukprot:RKO91767.1 major facilitator superfamily domain-containing protein [Blyttiomyces helicus]